MLHLQGRVDKRAILGMVRGALVWHNCEAVPESLRKASGRAAGARQVRKYEEQLGMRGRVIYYEPEP